MAEWVEAGRTAILQLLEAEYAVVWLEVEAKTADHVWQPPESLAGLASSRELG